MPFTPNKISAVVLYGKKTCNRLLEILNYWQTILGDTAWNRFFFLCVTAEDEAWEYPGEGEKSAGLQRLLNQGQRIVRCMHMTLNPDQPESWRMPTDYLQDIQFQMNDVNVLVQCICDDLSCAPPAKAAVSLVKSAGRYLGKENVNCLYYLMLREGYEARQRQRELVSTIYQEQPRAVVYLLSNIANNGSRLHKYELRRAAMCEILAASLGRVYTSPMVYTLGYTSLNANNQELYCLRRNAVAAKLREYYNKPVAETEAWNILKIGQAPTEFNHNSIRAAVRTWVENIADQQLVINPDERMQKDLRILSGITSPQEAEGLYEACRLFFKVNMTAQAVLRKKAENHIEGVIRDLRKCINMHLFPVQILSAIRAALQEIMNEKVRVNSPALRPRAFLQRTEDYLNDCTREVISTVRQEYVKSTAIMLARFLEGGYGRVEAAIEIVQQDNFVEVMNKYHDADAPGINLEIKYPRYAEEITSTINGNALNLLDQKWVMSAGTVYTEGFKVDEKAIRALMQSGIDELHRRMPAGYNGTFMDALRTEFNTDNTMDTFLGQYLYGDRRHMFYCPYITANNIVEQTVYFVDENLRQTPWVQGQEEEKKVIIAQNDNIERISFIQLNKDLQWMVESWTDDNRYFGTQEDGVLGEDGIWVNAENRADRSNNGADASAVQSAQENENPCNIQLNLVNGRFMLTWDWEAGMQSVLVSVNNQIPPKPIDAGRYTLDGGMDVTNMVNYGRNEVVLYRVNNSIYGKMSLRGKQHQVQYCFKPSNGAGVKLIVSGKIPQKADLLIREPKTDEKGCFFYPLLVNGLGGSATFNGLRLTGNYALMVSPNNKFPVVKLVQNIGLQG